MQINYALYLAVIAPIIDFSYELIKKLYWKNRLKFYCIDSGVIPNDDDTLTEYVKRAVVIDSSFRFFGWWVMSILGSIVNAYSNINLLFSIITILILLPAAWLGFFLLEFDKINGWKKFIPLFLRIIGYGVSILLAIYFPKFQ